MKNFEHEIKDVKNRFLKYYIYFDYFHDSIIKHIEFEDKRSTVKIKLSCEREWETGNYEENIWNPDYEYTLYFEHCKFFEYERESNNQFLEYINGRFKNSYKLVEIQKTTAKKCYHLRIQLADGVIDLIFHGFEMQKAIGNIILPKRIVSRWYFDEIKRIFEGKDIDDIRKTAASGNWIERTNSIVYLRLIKDKCCYKLALQGLEDEDVRIAAVHVLGELGNLEALDNLVLLMRDNKITNIEGKHIKDSIDKILFVKKGG